MMKTLSIDFRIIAVEIRQLVPSLAWSTDWDCDDFSFIRGGIVLAIKTLRDFLPDCDVKNE